MSYRPPAVAAILFLVFTSYYHFLSVNLPSGAGHDEGAHRYAVDFIFEHGRLATYPEDVERIHLTPYGTTRSYREPFAYLWGAAVSRGYMTLANALGVYGESVTRNDRLLHSHRQGSVLLAAFSVVLLFSITFMLTGHIGGSLLGAVAWGLLPQFAFLASYSNNDIAAVFVLLLLVFTLVYAVRRGTVPAFAILGAACGLVLLSKPTIWAPSLGTAVFGLVLLKRRGNFKKLLAVTIPVAVLLSAWWYAFNMYHHGVTDFRNNQVRGQLEEQFRTLPDDAVKSYGDLGYSAYDLLRDEEGFLTRTYKSSIGFIDWFKLSLGPVQYWSYGVILAIGLLFLCYSVVGTPATVRLESWRILAVLLLLSLVAQFCIYIGWNLVKDRQPHGRYLLPTLSFTFMSFGIVAAGVISGIRSRIRSHSIVVFGVLALMAIHLHAMMRYVVPFYDPRAQFTTPVDRVRIPLSNSADLFETNNVELLERANGSLTIQAKGPDPWLALNVEALRQGRSLNYVELDINADEYDWFRLYWDTGRGFSESNSSSHALRSKRWKLGVGFPPETRRLRLDIGEKSDNRYRIYSLSLGRAERDYPLVNWP